MQADVVFDDPIPPQVPTDDRVLHQGSSALEQQREQTRWLRGERNAAPVPGQLTRLEVELEAVESVPAHA